MKAWLLRVWARWVEDERQRAAWEREHGEAYRRYLNDRETW